VPIKKIGEGDEDDDDAAGRRFGGTGTQAKKAEA
jgi:beta-glucosidase